MSTRVSINGTTLIVSQLFPDFYGVQKFHKAIPLSMILSQLNPINMLLLLDPLTFVILPSTLRSPMWSRLFRLTE